MAVPLGILARPQLHRVADRSSDSFSCVAPTGPTGEGHEARREGQGGEEGLHFWTWAPPCTLGRRAGGSRDSLVLGPTFVCHSNASGRGRLMAALHAFSWGWRQPRGLRGVSFLHREVSAEHFGQDFSPSASECVRKMHPYVLAVTG